MKTVWINIKVVIAIEKRYTPKAVIYSNRRVVIIEFPNIYSKQAL
jgi:hypothetical protein